MWAHRSARTCGFVARWSHFIVGLAVAACGGGTGNDRDSGPNKTTLSVEAADADGGTLHYQWRVTAGTIENRDAAQTVWTLPDGPGLHFAYVRVSDGRGGWVEQQYAVASDALNTPPPARAPRSHTPPAVTDPEGATARLRLLSATSTVFAAAAGATSARRNVYLPDVHVRVTRVATGDVVFAGLSDLAGEVSLPKLQAGDAYAITCSSAADGPLANCGTITAEASASRRTLQAAVDVARNLRLFGHVALADGAVCGTQDEFFGLQTAATVQVLAADGSVLSPAVRVNHFGDYALDAAVPVNGDLRLMVQCEGYSATLKVPASGNAAGYVSSAPVELSHSMPNRRPQIVKMVANGPDGNLRGRMVVPEVGAASNAAPGADRFLAYKGKDTRLSNCLYYRALGAVQDCDAQGNFVQPIALDDWLRQNKLGAYAAGNTPAAADFINRMDLNLVRRMSATQTATDHIAFSVCNHPGPEGQTQKEVDAAMETAFAGEKRVACVTMEWGTTPGVNGGKPFTKFFTFGPDGALLPSINLDGRSEKYLPGACVACHGGTQYNGRFPDKGRPSPNLGAGFLPFDNNNYLFSSRADKSEGAQARQIYDLNQLVRATEGGATTAVTALIDGWYAGGGVNADKTYVPPVWRAADAVTPGATRFYHDVVGAACRTCHASLGPSFNWDTTVLSPARASPHFCGGTPDVAINASMPNALTSRDRVAERGRADPALAALMTTFLGCSTPLPDPVYPKR